MSAITSARCCHDKCWLAAVQVVSLLTYSLFAKLVYLKLEPRNPGHLSTSQQCHRGFFLVSRGNLWGFEERLEVIWSPQGQGKYSAWLEWFFIPFPTMKLWFRLFQTYWAKESLCIHPFGKGTWQLHRDEVGILMLTFPHTDLKTLENESILLLKQILKQVVSVLSVHIFVCHFTTWLAALKTSLSK